uniref:DNA-directed DNA polymerase n=1 Tax=Panagrolaimus davidi TaxID=227884 RepID=A0A914QY49_9BILA
MEPLAKRRREDYIRLRTEDEDFEDEFQVIYPNFCNIIHLDEKPEVRNVGIVKYYFEIIFNTSIAVENPRADFLNKIQDTIDTIKAEEPNAEKIGLILKSISENSRMEHDIHIPFALVKDDIVQFFSNRLEQMHESNQACDLFTEILLLEITVYKTVLGGSSDDESQSEQVINKKNLISPQNTLNMCLFFCVYGLLEIIKIEKQAKNIVAQGNNVRSRMHVFNKTERIKNVRNSLENPNEETTRIVDQLRRDCQIRKNKDGYGSIQQFEKIQDYLNAKYNHTYRLAIFDYYNRKKPEFKGYAKNVKYDIPILFYRNHFYAITNMKNFVNNDGKKSRYYCLDCESTFTNASRHESKCIRKCNACARFGYEYPCENQKIHIKCESCQKNFFNQDCFDHHKITACALYRKCLKCNVVYSRHNTSKEHVCGEKYCSKCCTYHKKRPCFIQDIKEDNVEDYRIVIFDFEARQDIVLAHGKNEHAVNYGVGYVCCTKCIKNNEWLVNNSSCKICGEGRRINHFSGLNGSNCLSDFMDWLFAANKEYKTIALAHYAGRYDCIFILRELFNRTMGHLVEPTKVGNKEIWMKSFNVDPLYHCSTIASACIRSYRKKHLQKNSLPLIPDGGYHKHSRASEAALRYFYWRRETFNEQIQFHDSPEGEKQIGKYKVDGYIDETKTVIEFNGCAYHGCMRCFKPHTILPTGLKAIDQFERTKEKENMLISMGYDVESVWECEINKMIERFDSVTRAKYFERLIVGPLDPRDAYFGGRTGPLCLYEEISKDEENVKDISLADIRSLYPSVNYGTEYPVGLPDLIDIPQNEQNVCWTKKEDNKFRGLIKCFVVPPKSLKLPVLPFKSTNGFLIFGLCRKCSSDYSKKCTKDPDYDCQHSDEQRGFLITTTDMELNLALEKGYVVTKVFSAYHFTKFSNELFAPYVRDCLKLKVENDDFPSDVVTEEDQQHFIQTYKDRFNIIIDKEMIQKNPGLRYISKLAANSMWGRFSLRNNLAKTVIVTTGVKANAVMSKDNAIISTVDILNNKEVMITYTMKKDFVTENASSNIIVSLWTTSAARIVLYRLMELVEKDPNCKLLYTDTDSILLKHLKGILPFPLGNFLGDMALEHCNIKEYVSGGCKQYALKIKGKNGEFIYILKIRGISITSEVAKDLHFESFKSMVKEYGSGKTLSLPTSRIVPHRTGHVYTVESTKIYRTIYQKGLILENGDIIPLGYK